MRPNAPGVKNDVGEVGQSVPIVGEVGDERAGQGPAVPPIFLLLAGDKGDLKLVRDGVRIVLEELANEPPGFFGQTLLGLEGVHNKNTAVRRARNCDPVPWAVKDPNTGGAARNRPEAVGPFSRRLIQKGEEVIRPVRVADGTSEPLRQYVFKGTKRAIPCSPVILSSAALDMDKQVDRINVGVRKPSVMSEQGVSIGLGEKTIFDPPIDTGASCGHMGTRGVFSKVDPLDTQSWGTLAGGGLLPLGTGGLMGMARDQHRLPGIALGFNTLEMVTLVREVDRAILGEAAFLSFRDSGHQSIEDVVRFRITNVIGEQRLVPSVIRLTTRGKTVTLWKIGLGVSVCLPVVGLPIVDC